MPKWMTIGELQIVDKWRVVDVGIKVHHMQRLIKSTYNWIGHAVIPTEHHWKGALGQDLSCHVGCILEGGSHFRGPHIDITYIRD
jgi:hypothetical protein